MISGAHVMVFTHGAADRAFFRDVIGVPHIDSGGGTIGLYEARHARP